MFSQVFIIFYCADKTQEKRSLFLLFYFEKQSYSLISICNFTPRPNTAIHFKVHRSLSLSLSLMVFSLPSQIFNSRSEKDGTLLLFFLALSILTVGVLNFKFIKGFFIAMNLHFFYLIYVYLPFSSMRTQSTVKCAHCW